MLNEIENVCNKKVGIFHIFYSNNNNSTTFYITDVYEDCHVVYSCKLQTVFIEKTMLSTCLCIGGLSHCEMSDDVEEDVDVSLVTGKLRHRVSRRDDDDDDDDKTTVSTAAVVKRDEQMTVADNSASMLCSVFTTRCTVVQSAVLRLHVICPSVRLVTLVDHERTGWKSWTLSAQTIIPTPLLFVA